MVTADGALLPLVAARLEADARGGLARVVLTQTFDNRTQAPLNVQYLLPLPADGVVSGFSFTVGDEVVTGEVQEKRAARARFERAVVAGHTAALIEQTRTSVFQQEVGNIPPGASVHAEILVDQPLRWLDEAGAWEWRFPTVVGPRYQGTSGRVPDAAKLAVDVADAPLPARMALDLRLRDDLEAHVRPTSPSHQIHFADGRVRFGAEDGARLDRDVVVQWPVAQPKPGVSLDVVRPAAGAHDGAAYGLLTLVPPAPGAAQPVARDLVVLIDTSGSMHGEPLDQAKRVVSAVVDTLTDQDRVELIAFDFQPRRFACEPMAATRDGKRAALAWIRELTAGGGTEMRDAVQEALRPLRGDAQRQVVLVTDGYIGFEREIVEEVRRALPATCRLHTVGVGSSVNRSLTEAAARAGAGLEVIIAPGEDPERAARRLVARTDRPVVTELVIEGEGVEAVAPVRIPDLFAGAPAQICLRLAGGGGRVQVRGRTAQGTLDRSVSFPGLALGQGPNQVAARFARERVADLEAHRAAGGPAQEIDGQIEQIGLQFQISTRRTSWVAVSDRATVDPKAAKRSVRQPHEAPAGVDLESVGLRAPAPSAAGGAPSSAPAGRGFGARRSRAAAPMKKGKAFDKAEAPLDAFEEVSSFGLGEASVEDEEAEITLGGRSALDLDGEDGEGLEEASAVFDDRLEDDELPTSAPLSVGGPGQGAAGAPFSTSAGWRQDEPEALEPPEPAPSPRAARSSIHFEPQDSLRKEAAPKPDELPDEALADGERMAPEAKRTKARSGRWAWLLFVLAALAALWWWLRPTPEAQRGASESSPSQPVDAPNKASQPRR